MKSLCVMLLMGFALPNLLAQDYAVTLKGDTIRGEVKILSYDRLDKVEVKETGKRKVVYTALEARTLFIKNEFYHTVQEEGTGLKYMKLLRKGFLSLYAYRLTNQFTYDGRYLVRRNGTSMEVPNLTFKKSMSEFLNDCDEVSVKIKNGDLTKKNLEQIIDEYNICYDRKTLAKAEGGTTDVSIIQQIDSFINELEQHGDFTSKKDALDILKDIRGKALKNEAIPNYLLEGLKSNLSAQASLTEGLEKLITLLKK